MRRTTYFPKHTALRRLVATVADPQVIRDILAPLGLSPEVPHPEPPQPPPAEVGRLLADVPF